MSPRNVAKEEKWSFLNESSRLRIFVRGVNAKKELFSWADLYLIICTKQFAQFIL